MDVELDPPQPEPIAQAIADLLPREGAAAADPWWQAGIADQLEQ